MKGTNVKRCAALAALVGAVLVARPAAAADGSQLLAAVRNPLLTKTVYASPDRIVTAVGSDGAISINRRWERGRSGEWYIEEQRYGGDLVTAGVATDDDGMIHDGLRAIDWGFSKQARDGSFPGTGDPFHSSSLFVESAARAILLLKAADPDRYAYEIATDTPKVVAAARWLNRPAVARAGQRHNHLYTHRRWILAAALAESAALSGDGSLAAAAQDYAEDGIRCQQPDGTDPERGGFDISYQALGLDYAAKYFFVCDDPTLRRRVARVITKGLAWERSQFGPDGRLTVLGSTRTGVEKSRSGKVKTLDYKAVIEAFTFGSIITGDPTDRLAAVAAAAAKGWT